MARRPSVLVPLAVVCIAAIYFAAFVDYGVNLEDEGLLLLQIARTSRGDVPYLDFHTGYTPGVFYLNAGLLWLFGDSVLPIRWVLVVVNTAAIGLLFALARPWAGDAIAATMALGYAALLPCFVGEFASFNVPYPAWYSAVAFLAVQWAMDRFLASGRSGALLLAGAFCGLAFGFKPNAGVLSALACGLTLALLRAGDGDPDRRSARVLLVLAALFVVAIFASSAVAVELPAIAGPTLVLIIGRLRWAPAVDSGAPVLWPSIASIAVGASVLVLPWAAAFLLVLGPTRFLREVLLVGSEADVVYAIPFPIPLGFPGGWPVVAAVGLVLAGIAGIRAQQRRMHVRRAVGFVALGAVTAGMLLVSWARMPEGVARSVYWQVQFVGFFLIPLMTLVVGVVLLRRFRRPDVGDAGVRQRRLLNALVFANCMFLMLWPRVDTMHLIGAMPSALVLGTACAVRFARAWASVLRLPEGVARWGIVAAGAGLALLTSVSNLAGPMTRPQLALDSTHVPVTVEAERGDDIRAFNALLKYLRERLEPGEPLFAFPALALVPYALDHPTPAVHDYFVPGRPDHRGEAEVVRALEATRPRYMVTMNRRFGFFAESSSYYFILREYVRRGWVLEARFGRFDVLVRRDVAHGPPVIETFGERPAPDALLAELADPDRERRRAAVDAFMAPASTSAELARLGTALAPDERTQLLLLRNLGEAGDARATTFLVDTMRSAGTRVRGEASSALTLLALREDDARYNFAPVDPKTPRLADHLGGVSSAELVEWMENSRLRRGAGVFAARALGLAGARDAIPILEHVLVEETRYPLLQVTAAQALVALGQTHRLCDLVEMLAEPQHEVQNFVPSYLIETSVTHPSETLRCVGKGLASDSARTREASAWIAGAAGLTALEPQLVTLLEDRSVAPRIAAIWALGVLATPGSRAKVAPLVRDPDAEVRAFATEALERIGAKETRPPEAG